MFLIFCRLYIFCLFFVPSISLGAPSVVEKLVHHTDLEWAFSVLNTSFPVAKGDRISGHHAVAKSIVHKVRVRELFMFAIEHHGFLNILPREFFLDYINLTHDLPKIMSSRQLREYGYEGKPFYKRLARYWGIKRGYHPKNVEEAIRSIIKDMNGVEHLIKEEFIAEQRAMGRLDNLEISVAQILREMRFIEHVVDLVDAGLGRPKELGSEGEADLASARFANKGDTRSFILAKLLEAQYFYLIREVTWRKLESKTYVRRTCPAAFLY